jgi:hypothetical protein
MGGDMGMRHQIRATAGARSRPRGSVLALLTAVVAALVGVRPALALSQLPDPTWKVRGKVFAMTEGVTDGNSFIYVGGKFARASEQDGSHSYDTSSVTRVTLDGVGDPSFAPIVSKDEAGTLPATVMSLALSADGSVLYLGGDFAYVNGVPRQDIAAVSTADGQLVPGFDATASSNVNAILVENGGTRVFIGGSFKTVDDHPVLRLSALDAVTGMQDPAWTPKADSTVRALSYAEDGATIFVSGHFTTMDGEPRQSVARLNLDGTLNAWQAEAGVIPSPMTCWDVVPSAAAVYLGCGAGPNFSVAFSVTSGMIGDKLWKQASPGNVESMALTPDGADVLIGGHFGTNHSTNTICSDTMELHGLAELSIADGAYQCWAPHLYPDQHNAKGAWALLVDSLGHVWVGGWFTQICFPDDALPTDCVQQQSLARFTI